MKELVWYVLWQLYSLPLAMNTISHSYTDHESATSLFIKLTFTVLGYSADSQ